MGGYVDKLRPKAGEVMEPSEQLLAAIRTAPRGSTMGAAVGGVIGAVVADRQAKKSHAQQTQGSMAQSWPMVRSAVAVTDRRVLIFDYTFVGKPKDLVGQFPLSDITSLDLEKGVMNRFRFTFNDGSSAQVECGKLEKVAEFQSAFESAKAAH